MAKYKQDDVVELSIEDYGMDGEGIAKIDEFVFFVPYTVVGEKVKAKVTFVKKNLIFCQLKEIITVSNDRVKPPCNRFARCGGCDLMHVDYSKQLSLKKKNVERLFAKNTSLDIKIDDTVACSAPLGYRNKAQLPFGTVNGRVAVGFYKPSTHKVVSITKCFLHGDWVDKIIEVFLAYANDYGLTAYEENTHKGLLRHLVVRYLENSYCIVVVINGDKLPFQKELIERLREKIGENFALYISVKKERNNVIMGNSVFCIKPHVLKTNVLGINMEINPFSFLQLNNEIRDKIYKRVIEEIEENCKNYKDNIIIDAYAGVGALGAIIAKKGHKVVNVEIVKEGTEDGKKLAKENGVSDRVTNLNGDASELLPKIINDLDKDTNTGVHVVLDPPRKGCSQEVLTVLKNLPVKNVVHYISCNPATLTRDVEILTKDGTYAVEYVTPYDMFPQTKHVESVICLTRK